MNRVWKVLLCAVILVSVFASVGTAGVVDAVSMDSSRDLFNLINAYRRQMGKNQISWAADVYTVAYNHSVNMDNRNELAHELGGKGPGDRLKDASIGYTCYVENVAYNSGYADPVQYAFDQWKTSSGHNKNMLSDCAEVGAVGISSSSNGYYFTFVAITRDGTGSSGGGDSQSQKADEIAVTLHPGELSVEYTMDWENTGNQDITIAWRVEYLDMMEDWLHVSPPSITIPPGGIKNFTFYFDSRYVKPGTTRANLVYTYSGNEYVQPLKMTVLSYSADTTVVELWIGSDIMNVNGTAKRLDAAPFIKSGRTVVPIRAISESFGAEVSWDSVERKVTVISDDTKVEMWIDSTTVLVNGARQVLDIAPLISNGRTFVPFRFIGEAFDADVQWDDQEKKVTMYIH